MALRVMERLGGYQVFRSPAGTELQLAEAVRRGLPVSALDHMIRSLTPGTASQSEVYRVVGSARTLQRKRSRGAPLSPDESDRLVRLARILVRAEEVLGEDDKARRWLATPNQALGEAKPLELLDSDPGTCAVEQLLGRIEHGVVG